MEVPKHPLADKIVKMKNVYDNGDQGISNLYVSFRDDDLAMRAVYNESDAMAI